MKTVGFDLTFVSGLEGKTGEEIFALGLLKGIYDTGISDNITVFAGETLKKELLREYPELRVESFVKTGRKFYRKKLKRYLSRNQLDIVYYPHVHKYMNTNLPCATAATVHGMHSKAVSGRDRRKTFRKIAGLDGIVAAGRLVKEEIITRNRSISEDRVKVICNPLHDIRRGVDIVLKKKFILSVNSDSEQKNLIAILKSFNIIKNDIKHDLVVIGSIDDNGRAYRYIRRTGIKDRIIITGVINRDILFGYYRSADLFVNASRYRVFGYTPLEAMACESKVLSVRIPAITDPPGIECDEYIDNPHNYKEIADKMIAVLNSSPEPDYLKERAERLMKIYNPEKIAAYYADFLGIGGQK